MHHPLSTLSLTSLASRMQAFVQQNGHRKRECVVIFKTLEEMMLNCLSKGMMFDEIFVLQFIKTHNMHVLKY